MKIGALIQDIAPFTIFVGAALFVVGLFFPTKELAEFGATLVIASVVLKFITFGSHW